MSNFNISVVHLFKMKKIKSFFQRGVRNNANNPHNEVTNNIVPSQQQSVPESFKKSSEFFTDKILNTFLEKDEIDYDHDEQELSPTKSEMDLSFEDILEAAEERRQNLEQNESSGSSSSSTSGKLNSYYEWESSRNDKRSR